MIDVAIVYYSGTGNTQKIAEQVAMGVETKRDGCVAHAELLPILSEHIVEGRYQNNDTMCAILKSDAVVFGSPTYMGSVSAQFKAFADASSEAWVEQKWAGKLAAGFTMGSNPSGDQLSTIQYMSVLANQHGMLWAGLDLPGGSDELGRNRLGSQSGLMSYRREDDFDETDLATARYLGARVASLASRLVVGNQQLHESNVDLAC